MFLSWAWIWRMGGEAERVAWARLCDTHSRVIDGDCREVALGESRLPTNGRGDCDGTFREGCDGAFLSQNFGFFLTYFVKLYFPLQIRFHIRRSYGTGFASQGFYRPSVRLFQKRPPLNITGHDIPPHRNGTDAQVTSG